jgi:uncharacterized UBP type Zn finger protein
VGHFHEIALTSTININVTTMLDAVLKPEVLSGSNQVFCRHCDKKQNVTRRMEIKSLGAILCLHVMRFTYDPKLQKKKKNHHSIKIPHSLNLPTLGKFTLTGLVLHRGKNANFGHYVAQVKCSKTNSWIELDDARAKPFTSTADPFPSNDAYLLFYTRSELLEAGAIPPAIPDAYQIMVNASNSQGAQEIELSKQKYAALKDAFLKDREAKRTLFSALRLNQITVRFMTRSSVIVYF